MHGELETRFGCLFASQDTEYVLSLRVVLVGLGDYLIERGYREPCTVVGGAGEALASPCTDCQTKATVVEGMDSFG
jgi:hypothetical protein